MKKITVCLVFVLSFISFNSLFAQNLVNNQEQKFYGDKKDVDDILKNIEKFSNYFVQGDFKMLVKSYTKDSKIFPPDAEIIEDKASYAKWFMVPNGYKINYHKVMPLEIIIKEKTAYDHGYYEFEYSEPEGGIVKSKGKYIIIWKKVDNTWKIYLDIWNKTKLLKI